MDFRLPLAMCSPDRIVSLARAAESSGRDGVAKVVTSIASLYPARLELGVGPSWSPEEFDSLGQDMSTRGRHLYEQIDIHRLALSGGCFDHHGENRERAIIGFADSVITPLREQVATPRADETTPTEQGGST